MTEKQANREILSCYHYTTKPDGLDGIRTRSDRLKDEVTLL